MKTLFKSLKITLVFCVFFSVFYILILWLFAQVAGPNKGNAEVATLDGKVAYIIKQPSKADMIYGNTILKKTRLKSS